jgi:hypothetical protein
MTRTPGRCVYCALRFPAIGEAPAGARMAP